MNPFGLKAMFRKECRENFRWAALALLGLSLGLTYAWYHLSQQSSSPTPGEVWSAENVVLTITTPLMGLALGLLQILPELRRDQWAFLIHRPVSRATLFFGKALPGVALYLLAAVLPLLGLALWAAQPSHVPAPFDYRFTLAGWAAILAGLPFYFAGLLVALRPARWYGSRALPLLPALLAPWAAFQLTEFWQVVIACLLLTAVLLLAAWGSFVTGGQYKEQTKPARFALGLTLYPAVLAVAVGVLMLLAAAVSILSGGSRSTEIWWADQKIDTQGRIFERQEHRDSKGHTTVTLTDPAGNPVDTRVWDNLSRQHKLLNLAPLPMVDPTREPYRYSDPSQYVLSLTSTISDSRRDYWYYQTAEHQIVGYSVIADVPAVTGYLGPNGFAQNRAQAGQFSGPRPEPLGFAGLHLLRFPQALYWYEPSRPTLHLLQTIPGGRAGTALLDETDNGNRGEVQALIVAAGNQLTAYTGGQEAPAKLFTIPFAFGSKRNTDIQAAMTPDRSRFFFWYGAWSGPVANHIVTVTASGRVLKTETIPPPAKTASAPPKMRVSQAAPALLLPPVVVSALALFAYAGHIFGWPSAAGFWNSPFGVGPVAIFSILGGLIGAVLAGRLSRRCGDSRRGQIVWGAGVFWLGGYGVLLLLALRAWPAQVPCPNCGRRRVVDRETCEHCGAPFARPKPDGTEIFDKEKERVPVVAG